MPTQLHQAHLDNQNNINVKLHAKYLDVNIHFSFCGFLNYCATNYNPQMTTLSIITSPPLDIQVTCNCTVNV